MTYLLTPEEIHNARYDQIAACMNAKEIAEDWCRRQAKKIVTIMGPAIGLLIDDNTPCKDGSVPVFQRHLVLLAHYWAELENEVGVFRSPQVDAAGKECPGLSPGGTCDATEAPCVPGSRKGCYAGTNPTALVIPEALPGKTIAETAEVAREIIETGRRNEWREVFGQAIETGFPRSPETHTCYYCDHEGTDVNRLAAYGPSMNEAQYGYCCDDGQSCDARTRG